MRGPHRRDDVDEVRVVWLGDEDGREGLRKGERAALAFEDFEGEGEIPFWGAAWAQWQNYLKVGYAVMIKVSVEPGRFDASRPQTVVKSVEYLSDIKSTGIEEGVVGLENEEGSFSWQLDEIQSCSIKPDFGDANKKEKGRAKRGQRR